MQKKSQSEVITTVLIILLVLVAVFIVYTVVNRMVKGGTEQASTSPLDISLTTGKIDLAQSLVNYTNISVSRQSGGGNLSAIRIIFKNSAGAEVCRYENKTDLPSELETRVYVVNLTNCSGRYSYDVYPVIKSGDKEIIGLKATIIGGGTTTPTTPPPTCTPSGIEVCDGVDNDCDGGVDSRSCGSDVGECVSGTQTCSAGTWGACVGEVIPTTELCDGLDNDCDSSIDEGTEIPNNNIDENCDGVANLNACGITLNVTNQVYFLDNDVTTLPGTTCFVIGASGITLDLKGYNIKGDYTQSTTEYGVNITNFNNLKIKNGGLSGLYYGIYLKSSQGNEITNIQPIFNNTYGIYLYSGSNNILTNNIANSNTYYGIYLYSGSNNNNITGNTANSNYYGGIYISSSSNNNITGNTANSNTAGYGILLVSSLNNNIARNTANSNYWGIYLSSCSNNTIQGNTANSNIGPANWGYGDGISLYFSSNNTIQGNTANSNNRTGLYLSSSSGNIINGNTACYSVNNKDFYCSSSTGTSGTGNTFGNSTGGKVTQCSSPTWPILNQNYTACP